MKKLIYTLSLLMILTVLWAQEVNEIEPPAEDEIVVGTIGGTVDVSALGGAVYSIPIQVPEGMGGIQPNLSIVYNSQSGNGLLGWGWNLAGTSAITRIGQTIYHDGKTKGVDFEDDRFSLDGQRLLLVNDTQYGANGAEYRTEIDGMTKIVSYSCDTTYGPACFKAWLPNGNIAYYGYKENTRIGLKQQNDVCIWLLDSIVDRDGNYVAYRYTKGLATCRLQQIVYTGNVGSNIAPCYSVEFNYSNRIDNEIAFVGNNPLRQNKILSKIEVHNTANSSVLWEYDFLYTHNIGNGTSSYYNRLESIYFSCNGMKYYPTIVNWGSTNNNSSLTRIRIDGNFASNTSELQFVKFTGDFNGDGYTDVISSGNLNTHDTLHVYINKGNPGSDYVQFTDIASIPRDVNLDWIYVGDFNGDGLDDFMCVNRDRSWWFMDLVDLVPYLTRKRSDGSIWFEECASPNGGSYWLGKRKELTLVMGDFLGNKRMSFIFQVHVDSKRKHKYIYFKGNNPDNRIFEQCDVPDLNAKCIRAADFNGDGITELWYYKNDDSQWFGKIVKLTPDFTFQTISLNVLSRKDKVFVGDFNGDGHADFLSYNEDNSRWMIRLFKQNKLHWEAFDITEIMPIHDPGDHGFSLFGLNSQYKAVEVADFNGDGKTDIAAIKEDGTLYDRMVILYAPFSSHGCAYSQEFNVIEKTDINVMWQKLICTGNFLGKENVSLFSSHSLFSLKPMTIPYSATGITDGMGCSVSFKYKYLMPNKLNPSSNDFYKITYNHQNLGGSGCFVVGLPIRGVEEVRKDMSSCFETTTYLYEDAIVHNTGRGFLGFNTIRITKGTTPDSNRRPSSMIKRHFSLNAMGAHYSLLMDYDSCFAISIDQNERVLSSVNHYHYEKKVNENNRLVYMPLISIKTSDQFDIYENGLFLNRSIQRNIYENGNGNSGASYYENTVHCSKSIQGTGLSAIETDVNNAHYKTIHEDYYHPENYSQWIVNRPSSTKTTSLSVDDPQHPISSIITWIYEDDNPFHMTRETLYPGGNIDNLDPMATYTEYIYDEVGNITNRTSGDILGQLPVATTDYVYYPNHRLLKKQTNQAGYETSYTYDTYYEYCNSTTDCNGLVTQFFTDPMGVNQASIHPDGTITSTNTTWTYDWDLLKPAGATYYVTEHSSGKPDYKVYYDRAGNKLRTVTYGFDGSPICVDTKYNGHGQVKSISEPFFFANLGSEKHTVFEYDRFHRNHKTTAPDLTSIETNVEGFTTTSTHRAKPGSNLTDQVTSATVNAAGWTTESVDANGTHVHYEYYPDGKLKWTQIGEDETTRINIEYDNAGNRTMLMDPNYGLVRSVYNAYGQLCINTDPKGNTTEYLYDILGRNIERIETDAATNVAEYTNWYYDWNGNDQLDIVVGEHNTIHYGYDPLGRLVSVAEQRDDYSVEMTTSYEYDNFSRVNKITYPTGVTVNKEYNERGFLTKIKNNGTPLWETIGVNEFGQIIRYKLGESIMNSREFDDSHRLKIAISDVNDYIIQKYTYDYDDFSNLATRKDNKHGMEESFLYDDLNRLTSITTNGVVSSMEYDDYGRMLSKQANGQTIFSNAQYQTYDDNGILKPCAISGANIVANPFPSESQSISYTMFDKVKTITQGNRTLSYEYGYDHQRIKMVETVDGTTVAEKKYYGNCEIIHKNSTIPYTYLTGPLGTFAVVRRIKNVDYVSFILKDHLGSWTTITDYDGAVQQELSFDAWGNLRDPETWSGEFTGTPMLDRGFTGHEHLYNFGLINMNGRMYDPVMSSFLSVDNYVQAPDFSQSFNRYAYCLNNPLKYTDPSGEVIFEAVMSGVIMGLMSSSYMIVKNDITRPIDITQSLLIGAASGALGGLAGYGAGYGASLLFSDVGVIPGALTGSVGGFAGGFAGTSSSAWMYGASFSEGLLAGLKSGGWGALGGMIMGGIQGGINAFDGGGDIMTGIKTVEGKHSGTGTKYNGTKEKAQQNAIRYKYSKNAPENTKILNSRIRKLYTIQRPRSIGQITTEASEGFGMTVNGEEFVDLRDNTIALGYTVKSGVFNKWDVHVCSKVTLNPNDFIFKATAGHELLHVLHHAIMGKQFDITRSETACYTYTINTLYQGGFVDMANKYSVMCDNLGYYVYDPAYYTTYPK